MMEHAFGGNVVKRVAIARGAATIGLRHIVWWWFWWRIGQGEGAEQISASAGTLVVRGAPDFLRPVSGLAALVKQRTNLDDHGRRLRLVDELFLASPTHSDGLSRLLHRDDRCVGGRIVGAIVAVAA